MRSRVKSIPYSCPNIAEEDIEAVVNVLRSEFLTQGPVVPEFEVAVSRFTQIPYCVAVSNATAALHLALMAMDVGVGSRVWTSPNSFLASANCARYCGATIDFVDIDSATRNISTIYLREKLEKAKILNELPDVVIPVDYSGLPCDLAEIRDLADEFGFKVLEDASHALGATYQNRPVGSRFADATVFSFHAVKIVTTAEGGMIATSNAEIAERVRLLRSHGMTRDSQIFRNQSDGPWYYEQQCLGYNYRMTELQAALGLSQLRRIEQMHAARMSIADRYDRALSSAPLILPPRKSDRVSSWHLYAVEINLIRARQSRREVFDAMRAAGIGVNVHYIPIHTQPYYHDLGFVASDFANSMEFYGRAISLPMYPTLLASEQNRVIDTLLREI